MSASGTQSTRGPSKRDTSAAPATRATPSPTGTVKRMVTVRYVPRMVTGRNFALVVMLSAEPVPATADPSKVQQVESSRGGFAISVDSPVVTVLPRVPGCLCVPERLELDVSRQRTTATFWLTPQADGDLRHASVDVWKSGYLLDTLPVPAKVRSQSAGGVAPGHAANIPVPQGLFSPALALEGDSRAVAEYLVAKLAEYLGREVVPRQMSDFDSGLESGVYDMRIDVRAKLSDTPALTVAGPIHIQASDVEGMVTIEAPLALYLDSTPLARPQSPEEPEILPLRFAPKADGGGQWEAAN